MRRTSQSSAGPTPEVVEDRQAQVPADGPESVGHGPGDLGTLLVAGGIEPMDQERQLLERIVVDVGRHAGTFRLGGGHDQVALERGSRREAGQRPDGEPAGGQDEPEPQHEREQVRRVVGGDREQRRRADDGELGRLEESPARDRRGAEPTGSHGTRGGQARDERDRTDERPARQPRVLPRLRDGHGDRERAAAAAHAELTMMTSRCSPSSSIRSIRATASGSIAATTSSPPKAISTGIDEAASGRTRNGTAVAMASGMAMGRRPLPARPLASHQPISTRIAVPRKTDARRRWMAPKPKSDTPTTAHSSGLPRSRSHGWMAWMSVIWEVISACSDVGSIGASNGAVGSTPITVGGGSSPVFGSGVG